MAYLYRLIAWAFLGIAGTFILLLPLKAQAAFPATSDPSVCSTAPCYTYQFPANSGPVRPGPLASACQAYVSSLVNPPYTFAYDSVAGDNLCYYRYSGAGSTNVLGFTEGSRATVPPSDPSYTCPANSTLAGSSCTCNSGFGESSGTCVAENELLCGALSGTETYASAPGNVAPGSATCNPTGCAATFAGTVIRVKNAEGVYVTEGAVTFNGSTCTYSAETGASPDSCPGGSLGTINGIATCVAYDPKLNTIESVKGSTNELIDGTDITTTGKTTTTVCNAVGACTTTTVTQTSVNGGAPTTTTETTEENRDDFCTKNPKDPQCGNSSFTGSCTGGFACTGDAIQCAAARQIHELNCSLNKETSQSALFNAERTNDTSPLSINASSKSISQADFSSSNSLGVASCIPNLSVTVMGNVIDLPFSDICDELAYLRLVLLACSWFIAYRTVAGSVREG